MNRKSEQTLRQVMSGSATGPRAGALRAVLALAEPFYAGAMAARNRLFDSGIRRAHRLDRPVVSIGNLTAGGTGKTPLVRWLAGRLRDEGRNVAILSRGYGASDGKPGDELAMLDRMLNDGHRPPVRICANPNRLAAGRVVVADQPEIDVFILDDGFQHRQLARDLDVVLINAVEPFGFGHVLPRGLLREPLGGLRRAGAVVLTHADRVSCDELAAIETTIRRHNSTVPIHRTLHTNTGLRGPGTAPSTVPDHAMEELSERPFFAFAGIGHPEALDRKFTRYGAAYVGRKWFADHHRYTRADLSLLDDAARAAGARVLVTTEKDWAKIADLSGGNPASDGNCESGIPIWRIEVVLRFLDESEPALFAQVRALL